MLDGLTRAATYAIVVVVYLADALVRHRRWRALVDELGRVGDALERLEVAKRPPPPVLYDQDVDAGP